MDLGLEGKRALVFGATSGIGRGIAAALIAEGAKVIGSARDSDRLGSVGAEIGAYEMLPGDLDVPGAARTVATRACERFGGLDILVTNCGGPSKGAFTELDEGAWRRGIQQVLVSAIDAIEVALPAMTEAGGGRVLLVTSSTGREPLPSLTISNTLRPGLHGLVNSLSKEVAAAGITVNAIMPGMTDTPRISELGLPTETLAAHIPAGRLARPDEIGALAAFLASEQAAYTTGQAIAADGGRLAGI